MSDTPLPDSLVESIASFRSCGVITGAGVSQESGIRTYRGAGGIYDDAESSDRIVDALNSRTLADDPDRTWQMIANICRRAERARPNPAHLAIAAIERRMDRFVLLTQCVDGLHRRAGSEGAIEVHGNVFGTRCNQCSSTGRIDSGLLDSLRRAPRCGICGDVLRPDIVLFGELVPMGSVEHLLAEFYLNAPELVIVAGTSAVFPYITEPVLYARQGGRVTVEINPEPTQLTEYVDFSIRDKAGAVLPAIARALGATLADHPGTGPQLDAGNPLRNES